MQYQQAVTPCLPELLPGPKDTSPAHGAGGYDGFGGQGTEQTPPSSPVGSGSDLPESKELGLGPCGEAGLRLHGDRLTVDFCYTGLGEGREVTAGPGSPGQLWPSSPPPALQDRVALPGLQAPAWSPGFCPPPLPTCPACDRPPPFLPRCGGEDSQVSTQTRTHYLLQGCGPAGAAPDARPPAAGSGRRPSGG